MPPAWSRAACISQELYALAVEVLPLEVPDSITVDVSRDGRR